MKKRVPTILAAVSTLAFAWLAMNRLDLADRSFWTGVEMRALDAKFRIRGERPGGNDVLIVGIDDKTLDKLGSFRAFQRDRWATLISKLAAAGPKAIGFDITFNDVTEPAKDQEFADAIEKAQSVVLGVTMYLEDTQGTRRPAEKVDEQIFEKQIFPAESRGANERKEDEKFYLGRDLKANLPELTKAAAAFGFVNFHADADGRLRYQPQVIEYGGYLYPSLDLQLLRRYLDAPSVMVNFEPNGHIDSIKVGNHTIPTDQFGRVILDYSGRRGTYQTISMIDVLEDRVGHDVFKDKIVLIGAPTVGLNDVVATPFDPVLPGVDLHANFMDNVLRDRFLYRGAAAQGIDLAVILISGIVLGWYLPKLNATRSSIYTILLLAAFLAFNLWAFVRLQWLLSVVYPGLSMFTTASVLILYKYLGEERAKKKTKDTFKLYLDRHVVEQVSNNPELAQLGGQKVELTILFSDIRGFTSFSEKMGAEEVVHFLNRYFEKMQAIIFRHHGTLDKLIGDAVMCFWGAPLPVKDHAVRGVITALEMIQAVDELRSVLVLPGGAKFEIGIGLNTGHMVCGNMGSPDRVSYTVMGDNVNLGSRLEALNKYYGTNILIADTTYNEIRDMIFCRELDTIQVKGREQAVTIYEPMGMKRLEFDRRNEDRRGPMTPQKQFIKTLVMLFYGERRHEERRLGSQELVIKPAQEEIATMYEHALALYRKGEFDAAEMAFDHVLSLKPNDGPSKLMKGRIAKYRKEALAESQFDPVYKFDEK